MKRLLNDGWSFALLAPDEAPEKREAKYAPVSLPHDFLISHKENLYLDADGWYRRSLCMPCAERVRVRFDGVYMDCEVFLDGRKICAHHYGYTAFDAELGAGDGKEHVLEVHVCHRSPNSRWYSGAGIFRDVTLHASGKSGLVPDGVYFRTRRDGDSWRVLVSAETYGREDQQAVSFVLEDGDQKTVCAAEAPSENGCAETEMRVSSPHLWSPETPYLYSLTVSFAGDECAQRVGFRETRFSPDEGFFLNGEHVKLHGVCLHHDLGALGAAFHAAAARRQLKLMKDMGVNAVRTSHNPPASAWMDLCDEMGLMVLSEAFDMWEIAKTPLDYARFFDADCAGDVASWIRRDRNHPSVIMRSVGNEIPDMNQSPRGRELTAMLRDEVLKHDPEANGRVTFGSNYMPWAGAQGCAEEVKLPGYNYAEKLYDQHHAAHPDWVIYGSETASLLQSRGIYHFPADHDILSDEDLQCSALMNSKTSWGSQNMEAMLEEEEKRPYTLGQFLWSGIDYIGEPTPYHTRSCYFGQADTACFPKDGYALCKAAWSGRDVVHIGVIWDFNPGQLIDVPVWTNMDEIELFLNGRSLGRKKRKAYSCRWRVPFERGELKAVGYGKNGTAEHVRRSFGDACALRIESSSDTVYRDLEDMVFLTVTAVDKEGNPVENAVDRVRIRLEGGMLLGVDNGDSTDPDGYRELSKRLFSGKLLIMAGAGDGPDMRVYVSAEGLESAMITIRCKDRRPEEGRARIAEAFCAPVHAPVRARAIELLALDGAQMTPERDTLRFEMRVHPENADPGNLTFRVANADGVTVPFAHVSREGNIVTVRADGDGQLYLRAACDNGEDHPRILSMLELEARGFGVSALDPYAFVSASLSALRRGDVTSGNEHGLSFARDGRSMIGFSNVDFGPDGSDTVELPIFALDDRAYTLTLWDGDPDDGKKIADLHYQKKCIWNHYQSETYRLPQRLKGRHDLWFSMEEKAHLKGFCFARQPRAEREVPAGEADQIYGDDFTLRDTAVCGIGNNVSLVFDGVAIERPATGIAVIGATPLASNAITLLEEGSDGKETHMLMFKEGPRHEERFDLQIQPGTRRLSFVFLPGCRFDFYAFRLLYSQPDQDQA